MSFPSIVAMLVALSAASLGRVLVLADRRVVATRATATKVSPPSVDRPKRLLGGLVAILGRRRMFLSPLIGMIGGAAIAGLPGAAAGAGGGLALAAGLRRRRVVAEREAVDNQLTDAVAGINAGLRAGLSLTQALAYAAEESAPPLGPTLTDVVRRCDMGASLDASLAEWSRTHGGRDARLLVGVLGMHRRSGGDLPAVLDRLASTLRARRAAHEELRSLTAQARLSGAILGFLPLGFFGFLAVTARDDLAVTLAAPAGRTAIALGFALEVAAFIWIRRLLRVEA